ncbi:MAG: hypothetical protein ABJA69_04840 [Acidobacteriaceae bacterium]
MKRKLIAMLSLAVVSLMFNTAAANAQTATKADVPFGFRVGSAQLPAGTYEVRADGASAISINNRDAGKTALSLVRPEPSRETSAKLIFHHVGNQYFLAEVWGDAGRTGMVIPRSKLEKNLVKELEIASSPSSVIEEVMIALK